MSLKSLLFVALALLMMPSLASADVSARQDSCVTWVEDGTTYTRVYFSVINFSLPEPVCDVHFIPEPQPPLAECTMLESNQEPGWSSVLNPLGGADWFANTPNDCIAPGTIREGFSFLLDPGFCCYVVQYTDATGAVMAEVEECFCGKPVQVENSTWGQLKGIYR
jgi:hypothetical protein